MGLISSSLANSVIDNHLGELQTGATMVKYLQRRPVRAAGSRARTQENAPISPSNTDPPTSSITGQINEGEPLPSKSIHQQLRSEKYHNSSAQHDVAEHLSENHAQSAEEDNALGHNKSTGDSIRGSDTKKEMNKAQKEEAAQQRRLHEARRHGRYLDEETAETFRVKNHTVLLPLDKYYRPGKERAPMHMLDTRRYTERLLETARAEGWEVKLWMGGSTPPREPQMEDYFEENL